ncbi:MAG: hypothetical protein AB1629_07530 [Candidatus Omnitrophota bacterium]
MIIFILDTATVIATSYFLALLFFKPKEITIDFLLHCFVIFFAEIIFVNLLLGIASGLTAINIIFSHIAIYLAAFLFWRKLDYQPEFNLDLDLIFKNWLILFAFSIFICFFAVKLWINLINPPICPDSLQYHLSFPATWLKNANLFNPIVVFGSRPTSAELSALSYYPINAELYFFWLMAFLRNAFLADAAQAPFYFIGIISLYSVLRKFSLEKSTAILVSLLWALIPNVFKQIRFGSQVDVMCAVFFLIVLNNLLLLYKESDYKRALIFGTSLGLFIGIKALNIFWSASLAPLFIYYLYLQINKKISKSPAVILSIMFLAVVIFGSFSYLRTFILTGNPFYPVRLNLFGKTILPGFIDKMSFSKLFVPWEEFSLKNMFFGEGLGLQFIAFIFPGTFIPFLVYLMRFRKINNQDYLKRLLVFVAPLIMLCLYLFYIKAYWIRYFFPYLGMGLISAAVFLNDFEKGKKYITIFGSIAIFSSAAELAHRKELIISLILSIMLFLFLFAKRKSFSLIIKNQFLKLISISMIIIVGMLILLNADYNKNKFNRYPSLFKGKESGERDIAYAWKWLNENTHKGKRVAYTGRSESYPLFGSFLKNDVYYISLNSKPPIVHYYPDGLYRKERDLKRWLINLKDKKIDYLFIALPYSVSNESSNPKEFPIEDTWAKEHSNIFKLVFVNTKSRIYYLGSK